MTDVSEIKLRHGLPDYIVALMAIVTALAAIAAVAVAFKYNRRTVEIAGDTLEQAKETRKEQRDQFVAMRKEANEDRDAEHEQFETTLRHEAKRQEEARTEAARLERLARSPLLVQYQCCNPVAIVVDWTSGKPGLRYPATETERRIFPYAYNRGHLLRIINLGQGTALRVSAIWHPEKGRLANGREFTIPATQGSAQHTEPFHIKPQEEAIIRHMPPSCYFEDSSAADGQLAHVEGYLELICVDSAEDDPRPFEYDFTMDVYCKEYQIGNGLTGGSIRIHLSETPRDQPSLEPGHEPDVALVDD